MTPRSQLCRSESDQLLDVSPSLWDIRNIAFAAKRKSTAIFRWQFVYQADVAAPKDRSRRPAGFGANLMLCDGEEFNIGVPHHIGDVDDLICFWIHRELAGRTFAVRPWCISCQSIRPSS